MSFSTQRDFINIDVDSSLSGKLKLENSIGTPSSIPQRVSLFPDITGLWNLLSGRDEKIPRRKAGAENSPKQTMASSESDSGINSESCTQRQFQNVESDSENYRSLDNVENLLSALQKEGKFTVQTIMELIKKYQTYITKILAENEMPEGELKRLLEFIGNQFRNIMNAIENLSVSEKEKHTLRDDFKALSIATKTFVCESKRQNEFRSQELERVKFDRQSLQLSLDKLSDVEDKIIDLKAQATKADGLQKEIRSLKDQLEKCKNNNKTLVECLVATKNSLNESEEKRKMDYEKYSGEMKVWGSKADSLNEMLKRELLEVDKWKIHSSRLSIELDRATDRVLKGHDTKRKLHFAESMRRDLERQIEEMMGIIKALNDQKDVTSPQTQSLDCQNALSNLLIQSKNTMKSILANINDDVCFNSQPSSESVYKELNNLLEENTKLQTENKKLKNQILTEKDEQIAELMNELEKCKSMYRNQISSSPSKVNSRFRKDLENEPFKKPSSVFLNESDGRKFLQEITELREQLQKCHDENIVLEDVIAALKDEQDFDLNQPSGRRDDAHQMTPDDCHFQITKMSVNLPTERSSESSNMFPSKTECICRQPLGRLDPPNKLKENSEQSVSMDSSFISSTSVDRENAELTNDDAVGDKGIVNADFHSDKKDVTIRELEAECASLRECISKLNDEIRKQVDQIESIVDLGKEICKLKEAMYGQEETDEQLRMQKSAIEESSAMVASLENVKNILIEESRRLQAQKLGKDAVKTEKDRRNGDLRDNDKDIEELELELSEHREIVETHKKQFNDKVRSLLEEKASLEARNTILLNELDGLDQVVDAINAERTKNRKLEDMINDLQQQLEAMHSRELEVGPSGRTALYLESIQRMKKQLEEEINTNNQLQEDLSVRTRELEILKQDLTKRDRNIKELKEGSRTVKTAPRPVASDASTEGVLKEYVTLTDELRRQLELERGKYAKLHRDFVAYSEKIEQLEQTLRDKTESIVGKYGSEFSSLKLVSTQAPYKNEDMERSGQEQKNIFIGRLFLAYVKNHKYEKELQRLQQELNSKQCVINFLEKKLKCYRKKSQINKERARNVAQNEIKQVPPEQVTSEHLELIENLKEVNRQLKEELESEKEKFRVFYAQSNAKNEELQSQLKKSRVQVAQLQNILKKRETFIDELRKDVCGQKSTKSSMDKEIQTTENMSLQSHLGEQVTQSFALTSKFSKEIASSKTLRKELQGAQKEICKLQKCVKEMEELESALKEENQNLTKQLELFMRMEPNENKDSNRRNYKVSPLKPRKEEFPKRPINNSVSNLSNDEHPDNTKLLRICHKIQKSGLKSLTTKQLTWLHCEVFKVSRCLQSQSESSLGKCAYFVASLPPAPASREEVIMARVNYMETELENANQVLQHLKKEYEDEMKDDRRSRRRGGETR